MKWREACGTAVVAAVAMGGFVGTARADGYAAPRVVYEKPANWTGIYGGVDAGWMGTSFDWAFAPPVPAAPHQAYSLSTNDGFVGVHGGYQHQFGTIVLGVEAASSITRTSWASETGYGINPFFNSEARLKNLITVGPRLGFAYSNLLFYGTGGWAHADIDSRATLSGVPVPGFDGGASHNGWFAGGGVEVLVGKYAFVGIEYKHVALDTERHCAGPPEGTCLGAAGGFNDRNVNADADIVTARLSLKWNRDDRIAPLK
jgi:outer membrane immunogenic protein